MTEPLDPFDDLEQRLDRRLTALPAPRAPETLLPRVMAAVRAAPVREASGWVSWPFVWQAASLAALVLLTLGVVSVWPAIDARLSFAQPVVTAGRVLWRVVVEPVGLFMVVFIAAMGAACAAFATALRHVAFGGITR
jgi:hypothetical protein